MASWTSITGPPALTHAAGDTLSVSDWNNVVNNEQFLYQAPYGIFSAASVQSVGSGAYTVMHLFAASVNYGVGQTGYAASTSVAGIYRVSGTVSIAAASAGGLTALIFKNGAQQFQGGEAKIDSFYGATATVEGLVYMNGSSDYVNLQAFQWYSSALNTGGNAQNTFMHINFVGSA